MLHIQKIADVTKVPSSIGLCSPKINLKVIKKSHLLLFDFQQKFESLYGQLRLTPIMHMHRHFKQA
uniref:Uncharacterized protein n=1 Tax=Amphimedon queenslandica TaxID=400682 RepID=A0A1X7UAH1_AMPQE